MKQTPILLVRLLLGLAFLYAALFVLAVYYVDSWRPVQVRLMLCEDALQRRRIASEGLARPLTVGSSGQVFRTTVIADRWAGVESDYRRTTADVEAFCR